MVNVSRMRTITLATPAQIRAGRALVGLTLMDLQQRSGVHNTTIAHYERQTPRKGRMETVARLVAALEEAGVEFIEDGVKLRRRAPIEDRE